MITKFIARFGSYIGVAAAVIVGYLAWDSSRVNHGRNLEKAAVEKQNVEVVKKARGAAGKSERRDSGGVLDPNTVAD